MTEKDLLCRLILLALVNCRDGHWDFDYTFKSIVIDIKQSNLSFDVDEWLQQHEG